MQILKTFQQEHKYNPISSKLDSLTAENCHHSQIKLLCLSPHSVPAETLVQTNLYLFRQTHTCSDRLKHCWSTLYFPIPIRTIPLLRLCMQLLCAALGNPLSGPMKVQERKFLSWLVHCMPGCGCTWTKSPESPQNYQWLLIYYNIQHKIPVICDCTITGESCNLAPAFCSW